MAVASSRTEMAKLGRLSIRLGGVPFLEKNMGSLSAAKMGDVMAILAIDDK